MAPPELRIGLIGCGTVGGAFAAALAERRAWIERAHGIRLTLAAVAVAHPDRPRDHVDGARLGDDAPAIADDPSIDVVIEASGAHCAGEWIATALARGAAAVTANKQALARDPALLRALAAREPRLWCEGAVAAAIPIIRALRESLAGDEVRGIRGVLNGTTTFVRSELERGRDFDDAVREAQRAGYAESDPTADLSGADAAAKLAILCSIAWREPVTVDQVCARGIDASVVRRSREAATRGARVRLVATASRENGLDARVAPELLEPHDPLATASGPYNVVVLDTALAGTLTWHGAGAGGRSTVSAVLADVIAAAQTLVRSGARVARPAAHHLPHRARAAVTAAADSHPSFTLALARSLA
jgi:homoserine dehydrogenase